MDTILKKANCCSETYNDEIVAKTMNVLLNLEYISESGGLYKKLDAKFTKLKNEFFTSVRFPDINQWSLQNKAIYTYSKHNIAVYTILWGGAYICPFKKIMPDKNNIDNSYDGYDFGSQDIIIYNISTKEFVIMNTWHIHAIYYHNNFGDEKYMVDFEKLKSVLHQVNVNKISITSKNELVYDNILTMAHNQPNYIMKHKPNVKIVGDVVIISAMIKSEDKRQEYTNFTKSHFKKKSGDPVFDKDFLHFALFKKRDVNNNKFTTDIMTNISNSDRSLIVQYINQTYGIKLVMDEGLYKYNLVNVCFPIMKDMYYYTFHTTNDFIDQ
jgi:hypothetical protein